MRWIVVLIPLLSLACARSITLGSECPDFEGPCPRIGAGNDNDSDVYDRNDAARADAAEPGPSDAASALDAAPTQDADVLHDASARDAGSSGDASSALFPEIRNPSFELPADAATPIKLDALGQPGMYWYGCRGDLQIVTDAATSDGLPVGPTEGSRFFSDGLEAISVKAVDQVQGGLVQELVEPLRAGERYALALDAWTDKADFLGEVELKLGTGLLDFAARPLSCILSGFTELASSGPIPTGGWTPLCLSFTPSFDANSITLLGSAPGNLFGFTRARLFLDNIRPVSHCP